jgi:hypothetical protein
MNTPTPDPLKKFSDELHALAARFQDHQVTLQEIIDALMPFRHDPLHELSESLESFSLQEY